MKIFRNVVDECVGERIKENTKENNGWKGAGG